MAGNSPRGGSVRYSYPGYFRCGVVSRRSSPSSRPSYRTSPIRRLFRILSASGSRVAIFSYESSPHGLAETASRRPRRRNPFQPATLAKSRSRSPHFYRRLGLLLAFRARTQHHSPDHRPGDPRIDSVVGISTGLAPFHARWPRVPYLPSTQPPIASSVRLSVLHPVSTHKNQIRSIQQEASASTRPIIVITNSGGRTSRWLCPDLVMKSSWIYPTLRGFSLRTWDTRLFPGDSQALCARSAG